MSKQQLYFDITYGHHNHIHLDITVEDGKIVKVYEEINLYLHGSCSRHTYTQENEQYKGEFEFIVSQAIKEIFNNEKDTYEQFVNSLNSEMLERYFKSFYIPK